jgi:hypothetical protein
MGGTDTAFAAICEEWLYLRDSTLTPTLPSRESEQLTLSLDVGPLQMKTICPLSLEGEG